MTSRRSFLSHSLAVGALGLLPGAVRADADTRRRFHGALAAHPQLAVYSDTVGQQAGSATLSGRLPSDLQGVFYRNGPGRFELGGERQHHWFDGDGFAQRWQIADGKISHRGRFVQTRKFTEESAAGQFLYPAFGTHIGRRTPKNNDSVNVANTNLLPFNGRVYALWEGGSATELDPLTLETVGLKSWSPEWKGMPFSAHPKPDPDGGLWNFGNMPGSNQLLLYRLDAQGGLRRSAMVPVPDLNMVHDFVVSARHLIFVVPPYQLLDGDALSLAERHRWTGDAPDARPLRVVVIAKESLQVRQVFELPARSVFHLGNAYEDGACTRFDVVLHEGDVLPEPRLQMHGELRPHQGRHSSAVQIVLDYAAGTARETRLFGASEFPRVAPQVMSIRHRKLLLPGISADNPEFTLNTLNLVDTDSGKVDGYQFDAGWQVEEHVLVPRRGARSETDGYLVGVAQDTRRAQSVLTVFDAARVSAGPLALARLDYRAPHCFHGNFLPA